MGHQSRRRLCALLFWLKTTFAVLLAFALMAFLALRVYTMHKDGLKKGGKNPINTPINIDPQNKACQFNVAGRLGRLEPESGLMIGYSPNWNPDIPSVINGRIGKDAAVYNTFMRLFNDPAQAIDRNMLMWHADEVRKAGGIFALTLEPSDMKGVTDQIIEIVADTMLELNSNGVPVLLRYGHEMNGEWTNYGYRPTLYKDHFRRMSLAVHAKTNLTAMLWSPNVGVHYPYNAAPGAAVQSGYDTAPPEDRAELDTNHDGLITAADDPYLPYYPGDDVVDWVGLSLYYYQDGPNNKVPQPGYFFDYLRGTNLQAYGADPTVDMSLRDFYQRFSVERNKPLALSESGAGYLIGQPGATEAEIKTAWYKEVLDPTTIAQLPNMKLVINFEEEKVESLYQKNWALTNDTAVLGGYRTYLNTLGNEVLWGNQLRVACDGSLGRI